MAYLRVSEADDFVGRYERFWSRSLIERTPLSARPMLADALAALNVPKAALRARYELPRLIAKVITAALEAEGASVEVARASSWLSVGLDEYGSSAFDGDDFKEVRDWLERNADRQKALVAYEFAQAQPDPQTGHFHFWQCEAILHGAGRPRDWYRWLLAHAATTEAALPLAKHCFMNAAHAALRQPVDFDIEMVDAERWVELNLHRWPQAAQWLESAWSSPLDDSRGDSYRRQLERRSKEAIERTRRHEVWATHLSDISAGRARPEAMHKVAFAYQGRFTNIRGETPEERVQELIGGDAEQARRSIAGIERTLMRADLPSVADILATDLEQRFHYLCSACLLGADLAQSRDPRAALDWSDDLVHRLIAFRLTHGTGDVPGWYTLLAEQRPQVVAEVLEPYARQCLTMRAEHAITGLWPLAREDALAELARLVVPNLLRDFPMRARAAQLRRLNTELLPAAVRHVAADGLKSIITERLARSEIDSAQRIAWLLVGLRFAPHRRSRQLFDLVGKSRARALRLGAVLSAQGDHAKNLSPLPAVVLARLIEKLAPHATPTYASGAGWVGDRERLRDLVRGLVDQLAVSDGEEAAAELDRLRRLSSVAEWRVVLDAALFEHVRAVRSARFLHPSTESVALALAGEAPANALDLAALVRLHLQDLQAHVRGDDTNSLRLFWRDPTADGRQPRIENECRDVLLGKLRGPLIAKHVSLHKETARAEDTRADLHAETVIAGQRKCVPIEIKKEDHPKLWTAWRDQLALSYMTDPASEGVGIYLVLWFAHQPRADGQGAIPATAQQLEAQLTDLIAPEDRLRLQVCVLDLSLSTGRVVRKRTTRRRSPTVSEHG